jgi:hypothetical protein
VPSSLRRCRRSTLFTPPSSKLARSIRELTKLRPAHVQDWKDLSIRNIVHNERSSRGFVWEIARAQSPDPNIISSRSVQGSKCGDTLGGICLFCLCSRIVVKLKKEPTGRIATISRRCQKNKGLRSCLQKMLEIRVPSVASNGFLYVR